MCFCLGLYIKVPCITIQSIQLTLWVLELVIQCTQMWGFPIGGVYYRSFRTFLCGVGVAGLCYEPGWICTTEAALDRHFEAFAWDFHEKGEVGGGGGRVA